MCGIFGFVGTSKKLTSEVIMQRAVLLTVLAREMESRGGQSWGLALPWGKRTVKGVGSIDAVSMLPYVRERMIYGHTRFATAGRVCKENAHPFTLAEITGCHNGVVYNHRVLSAQYARTDEVDSVHLLRHIEEGRDLAEVESYGALVWHHHEDPETIFFGRWNGGDFAIARTDIGYVFASTQAAVKAAAAAADVKVHEFYKIDEVKRYSVSAAGVRVWDDLLFTCRRSTSTRTWKDGFAADDDVRTMYSWAGKVGGSGPTIGSPGGGSTAATFRGDEWEADERTDETLTGEWDADHEQMEDDRDAMAMLAKDYGLSRNDAKRVFDTDFDPIDADDEFYWSTGDFNERLYNAVLEVIDVQLWAYASEKLTEDEKIGFFGEQAPHRIDRPYSWGE